MYLVLAGVGLHVQHHRSFGPTGARWLTSCHNTAEEIDHPALSAAPMIGKGTCFLLSLPPFCQHPGLVQASFADTEKLEKIHGVRHLSY